jgi:ribosomal protein L5
MKILENHIERILNFDIILKSNIKNINNFCKLRKVVLSAKLNSNYKPGIGILIELLTFVKPKVTTYKKTVLNLSFKQGEPAGIKVTLRKSNMINFLTILLFEILPSLKKAVPFKANNTALQCQVKKLFEYEDVYEIQRYLDDSTTLDIAVYGDNLDKVFFSGFRFYIG